jgi:sugar lactone lactonase YvrE
MRRLIAAAMVGATMTLPPAASAESIPTVIPLPGATSTEGIAVGGGSTFYAGDLLRGDIYRGNLRTGDAALFIDAPDGRMAVGMKVDRAHGLLVVAGGFTGQAFVYDSSIGAEVAAVQLADPTGGSIINDVVITAGAAWFTDSAHPRLYRRPIAPDGSIGNPSTLEVTGPAANLSGEVFNLNGITSTGDGSTLIVSHSGDQRLYTVNPATGESRGIAGADVPLPDGILLHGRRLWVVQVFLNQVVELRLSEDLQSATTQRVLASPHFDVPANLALYRDHLALPNMHLDPDTFMPREGSTFEVVTIDAR